MKYYLSKKVKNKSFEETIERVTERLKEQGFGILTDIDVQATLKKKLNEEFHPYRILGACIPPFAHKALLAEDKIGTMLPCNVIVQQKGEEVEVAAIDPVVSMQAVKNEQLEEIAEEIRERLQKVVEGM